MKDENPDLFASFDLVVINSLGSESGIPDLSQGVTFPILQDDGGTYEAWGASKWYIYFVDRSAKLRNLHYEMSLPGSDEGRLLEEVRALVEEGA